MKNHTSLKYRILLFFTFCSLCAYTSDLPTLTLRKNDRTIRVLTTNELIQINEGRISVTVDNPTDSKVHTYEGISLPVLLELVFGKTWSSFDLVRFVTQDGYQPVIPTERIIAGSGVIATGEKGYPGFGKLQRKNGESVDPGPIYLVWENINDKGSREDPWISWPWQITGIELSSFKREFPRSAPPLLSGNPAMEGFLAFRQHCIKCHTINGDGGNFGPELNYPVNVTEYWNEEWLARYIADPQSIRTNSKMIPFYRDVKNRQAVISSIILYLKAMKDNKIPDSTLIRSRDKKLIQTFNGGLNSN